MSPRVSPRPGRYFLPGGVGCRNVYEVRYHTFSPSRFTFTSIFRVRFSGSGLLE